MYVVEINVNKSLSDIGINKSLVEKSESEFNCEVLMGAEPTSM